MFAGVLDQAEPGEDLVGVGGDLAPETLLEAYAAGLFPMGLGRHGRAPLGWWSPDPRGVLPLPAFRPSRSLRRSRRRFSVSVDTAFADVVAGCADRRRPGRWITADVAAAYEELHRRGHAHSVEVRDGDGRLVGGLYGVAVGGLFAGESMFHRATDASKVAVWAVVDVLRAAGDADRRLFDVQWRTDHLATLGVVEVSRPAYRALLADALALQPPTWTPGPLPA